MLPTGIKAKWDDNNEWNQLLLLAFDSIREQEETEKLATMLGATIVK